jgi:hypothetical protein
VIEKNKSSISLDVFERRVLSCVTEVRCTGEEIHQRYILQYPRGKVMKVFVPPESLEKVERALGKLTSSDLVLHDLLSYTYKPLKKETDVYCLSNKGRSFLSRKKH